MARQIRTQPLDRKPNLRRRLGVGCAVLAAVVALLIVVGYWRLTARAPEPPEAKLTASDTTPATSAVPPLDQQLQEIQRRVRSGQVQPVWLVASPAELQARMESDLREQGVSGVRVFMGEGTLVAQGVVPYNGMQLHATVRLRPEVTDGRLALPIVDASIGSLQMPAALRERLQGELDRGLAGQPLLKQGVRVDGVTVTPAGMTLTGQTQPATQ